MTPSISGEKILVTGPTSQVAWPIVRSLLADNEVHGLARFSREEDRARLESAGVRCHALDLARDDLGGLPDDFDRVLNFAVVKSGDFDYDLAANAEGAGRLLARTRPTLGFLHCSSAAVYAYAKNEPVAEHAPLGDNHRVMFPTYSLAKIAAETVVRFAAREHGVPVTIARLSVPYGEQGGWPWFHLLMMKADHPIPVHPDRPNLYNPIHEDDYVAMVPRLLGVAAVDATVVNWGGSEPVALEDWCRHLGELVGVSPRFEETERALGGLPVDTARMHELVGRTHVDWRDGLRRMVAARDPEALR